MESKKINNSVASQHFDIDMLRTKLNVPAAVHSGVVAAENWKHGKQITEFEYRKAVDKFRTSPINGRKVKKNA